MNHGWPQSSKSILASLPSSHSVSTDWEDTAKKLFKTPDGLVGDLIKIVTRDPEIPLDLAELKSTWTDIQWEGVKHINLIPFEVA